MHWYDRLNIIFVVLVCIIYLIITPFLLVIEYKTNQEFKNFIICEYKENDFKENCLLQRNKADIIKQSNNIIIFVILFWASIIIEKDIIPNKDKINAFLKRFED
jgi:hypothetical protein